MKKLKLTLIFFILCSALILLLTACDNGNKPSDKQILEDLSKSFAEENAFEDKVMDLKKFTVELSESGEKEYNADLNITAKSNSGYAEIYWKANVKYLKYDQGWRIEECSWDYSSDSYKVVKYPNKNEISNIICNLKGEKAKVEKFDILKNESKIQCYVISDIDWSPYGKGKILSTVTLDYSTSNDRWKEYSDEYIGDEFALKSYLAKSYSIKEGKYVKIGTINVSYPYVDLPHYYAKDGKIIFSNITDKGLDVVCKSSKLNVSKIHMDIESIEIKQDFVRLNFAGKDDVAFNGGVGTAHLYIDLPKSSHPNGDIEIEFWLARDYYTYAAAYANTD